MPGPIFAPVMDPYDVRVIATYLARAFNGNAAEVDPLRSPVWPLAARMVTAMRRDNYVLGAYTHSELATQHPHVGGAVNSRQVRAPRVPTSPRVPTPTARLPRVPG